jgi:uncharacterized protein
LWRVVRLLNPAAAVTQELRERFSRQLYEAGRDNLARHLASAFVKEVGRAAIDLYGGQLRIASEDLRTHVTGASREGLAEMHAREGEPLRILVAGQTGAGKSSVVNALACGVEAAVDVLPATARFTPYKLTIEGLAAALLIDSPGIGDSKGDRQLLLAVDDCDMLLWVVSAARASREIDARVLTEIRKHFAVRPNRRRPPTLLVVTHIDTLRPFNEWGPPYDLVQANCLKSQSIRGVMEAAGSELGFVAADILAVRVDTSCPTYNVDVLWAKIIELMPQAQNARLLRTLGDAKGASRWGAIWSQAVNAGRVIKDTLLTGGP